MSKRLEKLKGMVAQGTSDPFVRYALAMEYRSAGETALALETFAELRKLSPDYLPMYLLCGQLLADDGQRDSARDWLGAGIALAQRTGDGKALSELRGALDALED